MTELDWDDIRYFLAVARAGTVSRAGTDLNVSYTTVSRRIQGLERALNVRLFDRAADGYRPTPEAQAILRRAERVEDEVTALERQLYGLDSQIAGRLRITMAAAVGTYLVAPVLNEFRSRYPEIALEIITTADPLDLNAREADIALRVTPSPPDYLIGLKLADVGYGIYGAGNYLRRHPALDHPDVQCLTWIDNDPMSTEWIADHFPRATPGIRFSAMEAMLAAIIQQLGIGVLPSYIGDSEPALRRLRIDYDPPGWGLWLLSHVDYRDTEKVRVFKSFVRAKLAGRTDLIAGRRSRWADEDKDHGV